MLEPVEILAPDTWEEALATKAAQLDAVPIAGGTDLMVALNFDRARPEAILDLKRVPELRDWSADDGACASAPASPHAAHRRARRPAPGAGHRLAHGGLAADPQQQARWAATWAPRRRRATGSRRSAMLPTPRSSSRA